MKLQINRALITFNLQHKTEIDLLFSIFVIDFGSLQKKSNRQGSKAARQQGKFQENQSH